MFPSAFTLVEPELEDLLWYVWNDRPASPDEYQSHLAIGARHEREAGSFEAAVDAIALRCNGRFCPRRSPAEIDAGRAGRCAERRVWQADR